MPIIGKGYLRMELDVAPTVRGMRAAAKRADSPFSGQVGRDCLEAFRVGNGGLFDQFRNTEGRSVERANILGETSSESVFRWKRTLDFGSRRAPNSTLDRTGDLKLAWVGPGAKHKSKISDKEIVVTANTRKAAIFNNPGPMTIKPKVRTASGRWAMQIFLGLRYGVWLSSKRLERGFVLEPRRVGVSARTMSEIADIVRSEMLRVAFGDF